MQARGFPSAAVVRTPPSVAGGVGSVAGGEAKIPRVMVWGQKLFLKKREMWFVPKRHQAGREVGGGFRMGNTCTPVVDSC